MCASPRITRSTRQALSKAFYGGAAVPLSVVATPGTPGYLADFKFEYSPEKAKASIWRSPASAPDKPAKIGFAATNGQFPSDYDIARAIAQMWKKVGIEAELEIIEYAKYFELNRGAKLPEATLYSWDNATGDPEIFAGYLLNPKMPFSAWKGMEVGEKVLELFNDRRLREAHRRLPRRSTSIAVEAGATIPLLQSVHDARAQEEPELRRNTATAGCSPTRWSGRDALSSPAKAGDPVHAVRRDARAPACAGATGCPPSRG